MSTGGHWRLSGPDGDIAVPVSGTLRINTSRAASYMLLMPFAARFLAAYPDIRLEIGEDDSFVDIVTPDALNPLVKQ